MKRIITFGLTFCLATGAKAYDSAHDLSCAFSSTIIKHDKRPPLLRVYVPNGNDYDHLALAQDGTQIIPAGERNIWEFSGGILRDGYNTKIVIDPNLKAAMREDRPLTSKAKLYLDGDLLLKGYCGHPAHDTQEPIDSTDHSAD